jgi:hypothetical protein
MPGLPSNTSSRASAHAPKKRRERFFFFFVVVVVVVVVVVGVVDVVETQPVPGESHRPQPLELRDGRGQGLDLVIAQPQLLQSRELAEVRRKRRELVPLQTQDFQGNQSREKTLRQGDERVVRRAQPVHARQARERPRERRDSVLADVHHLRSLAQLADVLRERGEARVSLGHDARLPRRLRALQRAVRPVVVAPELIHGHGDVPAQLLEALLDLREERVHGTRSTTRGRDTSTTPRATSSDDAQFEFFFFDSRSRDAVSVACLDSKIRQNVTRFGVSSDGSIDPRGTAIRPAKLTGDSTQGITVRRFRSRNRTRDRIDDLFFWALTVSH